MADRVTYDATTSYGMKNPYRTEALYAADKRGAMRLKPGQPVQVIKDHGDTHWTEASSLRWENVPHMDGQCQRFIVRLADGTEHMVDESRIRPKS